MLDWTDRHSRVTIFAVRRFMHAAYQNAEDASILSAASPNTDNQAAKNMRAFFRDARTAEQVLAMLPQILPATDPNENNLGDGI